MKLERILTRNSLQSLRLKEELL